MTLHELVKHLLEGKRRIALKDVLEQWVMDYLLCVVLPVDNCLLYNFLLDSQYQLKKLLERRFLGQLVLDLRVNRLSSLDSVYTRCKLDWLMGRGPLFLYLKQLSQIVELGLIQLVRRLKYNVL